MVAHDGGPSHEVLEMMAGPLMRCLILMILFIYSDMGTRPPSIHD